VRRQFFRYLLGRAIAALVLVFLVSSGALLLAQLAPGDYASQFGRDPVQIAAERHRLGLDRPFSEQYGAWLKRSITFDLGESFQYHRPVTLLVRERAANTAMLAVAALILATALGIPGGILTGSSRGPAVSLVRAASLALLAVPPLITSLILLTIAARTGWLPVGGMGSAGPEQPWLDRLVTTGRHLVIPALALALPLAATIERLQGQALREALARPNTIAARARGLPHWRIVARHGWRLSLGPLLAIYGVLIGSLFSGSFAVELVTSWPGLGDLMLQALLNRDTNLVAGCAAAGALFLALGVFAADVLHGALDPRVEMEPQP
jgi:ABC-type dipeptide/oligopeptide/nickel transport system permease component